MRARLHDRTTLKISGDDTTPKQFVKIAAGLWRSRFEVVEITDEHVKLTDLFQPGVSITVART